MSRWLSDRGENPRNANLLKDPPFDLYRSLLSISVPDLTVQGFWAGISRELQYGFVSALALLPTAYRYVHYTTLGFMFPTTIERLLWKISCILFMASGGGAILLCFILYLDDVAARRLKRSLLHPKPLTITDIESRASFRENRPFRSPLTSLIGIFADLLDFLPAFLQDTVVWLAFCRPFSFVSCIVLREPMWFWSLLSLCAVFQ